jgi:hypothetical protein
VARQRWLSIKAELLSGRDLVLDHPPGRVMIASPSHTLAELGEAIDVAFARWAHSHLHEFQLGDGKRYMLGGSDFEPEVIGEHRRDARLADLDVGMSFEYVFDLGDDWRHRCEVQSVDADPAEENGSSPEARAHATRIRQGRLPRASDSWRFQKRFHYTVLVPATTTSDEESAAFARTS